MRVGEWPRRASDATSVPTNLDVTWTSATGTSARSLGRAPAGGKTRSLEEIWPGPARRLPESGLQAWAAVKEFMERDGALPESIEWADDADVPEDAFPNPYLHRLAGG